MKTPEEILTMCLRRAAFIGKEHGITEPGGVFDVGEILLTLDAAGYVIVPKEPTEHQLAAGARSTMDYPDGLREATCWVLLSDNGLDSRALAKPYRAMIAAKP